MASLALPLSMDAAFVLSLDAFLMALDGEGDVDTVTVVVETLAAQQVKSVRRFASAEVCPVLSLLGFWGGCVVEAGDMEKAFDGKTAGAKGLVREAKDFLGRLKAKENSAASASSGVGLFAGAVGRGAPPVLFRR